MSPILLPLALAAWNCLGGRGILPFGRVIFRCLLPALALWAAGLSLPQAAACALCLLGWLMWPTGPGFAAITGRDERRDEFLSRLASRLCRFGDAPLTQREAVHFGTAYIALRGAALCPLFLFLAWQVTPWALLAFPACLAEALSFRLVGRFGEREESVAQAELLAGFIHGAALALILATV